MASQVSAKLLFPYTCRSVQYYCRYDEAVVAMIVW